MTIDQIRNALSYMEVNFAMAIDARDYSLADAFKSKINLLYNELVDKIQKEDPYSTEADIRYS